MIYDLDFGAPVAVGGRMLRPLRFVRRSALPTSAVCFVANGIRDVLRRTLGANCELDVGEPAIVDEVAWKRLAASAYGFCTRGRRNDAVLLVTARDARTIVLRAFGEDAPPQESVPSALELLALERLAGEIADTFVPLYGERRSTTSYRPHAELPTCSTVFEVRVRTPIRVALCIALARDVARPLPSATVAPAMLSGVEIEVRAEFAVGNVPAKRLLDLAVGDVVPLDTKVGDAAALKVGSQRVAIGDCGIAGERAAFLVRKPEAIGVAL